MDTLCVTEENNFKNEINPIKLGDIDWCNDYKLSKLLLYQLQNIKKSSPEELFGFGID